MKYTFSILLFFLTNHLFSLDYILEFQANINILKEFDISKKEKFRSYKLEGIIISDIKDNKLIKLEGTAKTIYANNDVLYI